MTVEIAGWGNWDHRLVDVFTTYHFFNNTVDKM